MTNRYFFTPLAAALLALNPVTPLMTAVQAAEADGYEFVTAAEDNTLYFGKHLAKVGNQVVVEFKAVNDPEETEDYEFVQAVDCGKRLYKDDGWVKAAPDTIAANWLSWACGVGGN